MLHDNEENIKLKNARKEQKALEEQQKVQEHLEAAKGFDSFLTKRFVINYSKISIHIQFSFPQ